ncbi:hypothetical protein FIBSPDRAFT_74428 [Athelia psychrophila]|uniref:Uncharacterized protein n=1 Tax=Athelia psychrophila TaxID=1759441 RepID=A0A166ENV2_9AGAM|nr:hypothetical protein FIBSPDRAFT_74428 [Fibularhizoctonia sp. CBS 109695]
MFTVATQRFEYGAPSVFIHNTISIHFGLVLHPSFLLPELQYSLYGKLKKPGWFNHTASHRQLLQVFFRPSHKIPHQGSPRSLNGQVIRPSQRQLRTRARGQRKFSPSGHRHLLTINHQSPPRSLKSGYEQFGSSRHGRESTRVGRYRCSESSENSRDSREG